MDRGVKGEHGQGRVPSESGQEIVDEKNGQGCSEHGEWTEGEWTLGKVSQGREAFGMTGENGNGWDSTWVVAGTESNTE